MFNRHSLRHTALIASLMLALASNGQAQTQPASADKSTAAAALTLEQLFRAQPYRGEPAREAAFSKSGRYLAYLWNPFGEPGGDLHVHDTRTGKTQRITSRQLMASFDSPEDLQRFDLKRAQRQKEWDD